ncbi:MAG: 4Fe-4S dicluster domain-containing protein [Candidatus Eisenbacteria bacterium]|uniref:4Fe-4S dicluster domain-containing protein n=1 Tax=Eiseniibacteriota bacterium TaxID=2212470 RepID=A0A948RXV4_UNCEI|nr:4Fe-4S dicluster domain-containing protein [Candidatus Eisenbacteria bacterium]MBU1948873.1 4Fe-4S dicluster domain-containing protein [Candidatus Eisenbacteria bacterium]MBU2691562.1 4Fe-4S dicluster domain-containing protein [Candidatus Eisenbacteria bacterium]
MNPVERARIIIWIRRIVQAASLTFFILLMIAAHTPEEGEQASGLLKFFFNIDPLVLIGTWLSTQKLTHLSLLALATVGVTFVLGRVFCGWICPFGVLHNIVTWFRNRRRKGRPRFEVYSRWQRAKYALLFGLLISALFGAHWIGVFDPASMFYRSMTTTVFPSVQHVVDEGATLVYQTDPHVGSFHFTSITEPIYGFFRDHVFHGQHHIYTGSLLLVLLFLAAILLNLVRPRFWCRYVCPLGGLLGLIARRSMLRLRGTDVTCVNCGLCTMSCPAAAQPEQVEKWLPHECFGCWNCVASCKRGGLHFQFEWPWKKVGAGSLDISKRLTLSALAAGFVGFLAMRLTPQSRERSYNPKLIRPPGALDENEFLERCIQCGACIKACPTNVLQPALSEAGVEGVWTPVLIPQLGYCEYKCNLCGQVCPTGAIQPLPLAEKQKVKMGLASFDTTRCLPYAYDRQCIVCEEHCPIPTKAIYFHEKEIVRRDGSLMIVKQPRVDPELCTGCGICETKCVFRDRAAIRVTSANETRHPGNRPMLPGGERFDLGIPEGEEGGPSGVEVDPYGGANPYE